jgi:hypothetical protein
VVHNLTCQGYEVDTPPGQACFGNDENVASETVYDGRGYAIASIQWRRAGGATLISLVTRTYYDGLGRPVAVVRNLTGQPVADPNPPTYDPEHPDQNLRSDTVYDAAGSAIATLEWIADEFGQPVARMTRTYYDALGRPVLVVRNLHPNHGITNPDPPTCNRDASGTEEPYNICIETVYDKGSQAIATLDPLGRIARTYYDGLGRPETAVSNLVGQTIENPVPPNRNPAIPDENVRSDIKRPRICS